ncbi:MAG: M48 family metallopeptidase [Myxococcales bacterium]|nr:M48 family metallopeptidase [Myxococcales bacterium]
MTDATPAARGFSAKQSWRRTLAELLALAVAAVLLFVAGRGCLGYAAEHAALAMPPAADAKVGKLAADQLRRAHSLGAPATEAQTKRCERVFEELTGHLLPAEAEMLGAARLTVVTDASVNAFALPGGEVFVLTGLLDRVGPPPEGDALLRGVLAHELGHAVLRHGMRNIARSVAFTIALRVVFGGVDQLTATLAAGASQLDGLRNSRDMETEADDFGATLLRRGGFGSEGLAQFLESLESQPVPELLSTHPDARGRAMRLREAAR